MGQGANNLPYKACLLRTLHKALKYTELQFHPLFCMGVKLGILH